MAADVMVKKSYVKDTATSTYSDFDRFKKEILKKQVSHSKILFYKS